MSKFLDGTGLSHLIDKIKSAFVAQADTVAVTGVDIDNAPTQNSDHLVTSGGVYTELAKKYEKPSGGIPASDLASGVIPDVSGKENTSNKVTSLSVSSTDTQYPSAKCVYDIVGDVETLINAL